MTAKQSSMRICAALSAALFATPALAQEFDCLWGQLPTSDKARLELADRLGESPARTLIARRGETWFADHMSRCGFPLEQQALIRVAHFIDARAGADASLALLTAEGLPPGAARAALDAEAPPAARRALADEILNFGGAGAQPGPAVAVVQAVAERLERAIGGEPEKQARLSPTTRGWAIQQILVDGLKAGAQPGAR